MNIIKGNIFLNIENDALVNTVNTVGVMGKGIALEFKKRFPEMFKEYKKACERKEVKIGKMWLYQEENNLIISFPTKQHWWNPSEYSWIESGLIDLRKIIIENKIKRIRIPALGCSNGQLDFSKVIILIEKYLGDIKDVEIIIYQPF